MNLPTLVRLHDRPPPARHCFKHLAFVGDSMARNQVESLFCLLSTTSSPVLLDTLVSGGVLGVEAVTLTFMVGGLQEAYLAAKPLFLSMGNCTIYCGGNENGVAARICYNLAMAIGFKYDGNSFDNGTNALQNQSSLPDSKNKSNGLVKGQPILNHVLCIEKSVVRKKPKKENATSCLGNLVSSSDQDLKLLVARESGIKCPKNYWEAAPSVRNLEDVVGLLSGSISSFGRSYFRRH
ncbi:hypothetical protein NE237_014184 [Protea cynaroides]|uniref:3-hydroxyisobutyrate dehydrogenase n=1 Tax=Protea cynaroides TaxID=273540 RepID=A0A9Q0GKL2_9MAGN|nr:hypothetical protein NE237_014184 [Protea cynaroides]